MKHEFVNHDELRKFSADNKHCNDNPGRGFLNCDHNTDGNRNRYGKRGEYNILHIRR